jgi:hypothetical protein
MDVMNRAYFVKTWGGPACVPKIKTDRLRRMVAEKGGHFAAVFNQLDPKDQEHVLEVLRDFCNIHSISFASACEMVMALGRYFVKAGAVAPAQPAPEAGTNHKE